uniref:Uncharacterized protein n=1 Tax=Sphaerodactylus townsendi TaxID=933632 RepID=A0ACB8G531_9SAUR
MATLSFATNLQVAEHNRAASKVPKLGKMAAARRKSVKKTAWMEEPAHQSKEQRQSCGSLRGAPAARRKGEPLQRPAAEWAPLAPSAELFNTPLASTRLPSPLGMWTEPRASREITRRHDQATQEKPDPQAPWRWEMSLGPGEESGSETLRTGSARPDPKVRLSRTANPTPDCMWLIQDWHHHFTGPGQVERQATEPLD